MSINKFYVPTEIPQEGGAQSYMEELLKENNEQLENVRNFKLQEGLLKFHDRIFSELFLKNYFKIIPQFPQSIHSKALTLLHSFIVTEMLLNL